MLRDKNTYLIIFFLILLNLTAHFIPFERASLSPDNYSLLLRNNFGIKNFLLFPDRPILYIWLEIQNIIIGENSFRGLIGVFLSSLLTIFVTYLFLSLFFDKINSIIIIIIYSLFVSKLEIFHTSIFININIVSSLYIISLINFIVFIRNNRFIYYFFSLILYSIGIFWYEIGVFLPIVFFIFSYFFRNNNNYYFKKSIYEILPFIIILLFYLTYRSSGAFGYIEPFPGHQIFSSGIFTGLIDIAHHFMGRYLIRNIIYGIYLFSQIELKWLVLLIFLDILFFTFLIYFTNKNNILETNKKNYNLLFFSLFVILLIPNILAGSTAGRHLIIPAISFSILLFMILKIFKHYHKVIFILFSIFSIIICQGNAWAQVISCRINASVYETLKENKNELIKSDYLIIDTRSFADNIKFTFVDQEFNVMNTYFGAQAFQGLESMVTLALGKNNNNIKTFIATESPKISKNGNLIFYISKSIGYRSVKKVLKQIPKDNVNIIDFNTVYKYGYKNGKKL